MSRTRFTLLLPFVAAACGGPSEPSSLRGVTLTPTAERFVVGQPVAAILANGSHVEIGYGAGCDIGLERPDGVGWKAYGTQRRPCLGLLNTLSPGAEATIHFPLDASVEPGTYRLRMPVAPVYRGSGREVRSGAFTVTPPQ
jgi:hypothetical protein